MDAEKVYLEEGDEIVADFVYFTLGENNKLEDAVLGDSSFWYEGVPAYKDDDGRFYILEEVEAIHFGPGDAPE